MCLIRSRSNIAGLAPSTHVRPLSGPASRPFRAGLTGFGQAKIPPLGLELPPQMAGCKGINLSRACPPTMRTAIRQHRALREMLQGQAAARGNIGLPMRRAISKEIALSPP